MDMNQLVDKYFNEIEVESCDCVPVDNAVSDAAQVCLIIPTSMLKEYAGLKGIKNGMPDEAEFWKETGLVTRLRDSGKYPLIWPQPLNDMLDYLAGNVRGTFYELGTPSRIRLYVTEIPEFIEFD